MAVDPGEGLDAGGRIRVFQVRRQYVRHGLGLAGLHADDGPFRHALGKDFIAPADLIVSVAARFAGLLGPGDHVHRVQQPGRVDEAHPGLHGDPEQALLNQEVPAHAHGPRRLGGGVHEQVEGVGKAQFAPGVHLAGQYGDGFHVDEVHSRFPSFASFSYRSFASFAPSLNSASAFSGKVRLRAA